MRTTIPFKISQARLFLQDLIINLDDFTMLENETIFSLEQLPLISFEKNSWTQVDITIEMNLDEKMIARDGYTILDYLSDIGGM